MSRDKITLEPDLVRIPAGEFLMGSEDPEDDYHPLMSVYVSEFRIAKHTVTNAEFERFVAETRYTTDIENHGIAFLLTAKRDVKGACWRHPIGPGSSILKIPRHPVVQISRYDALAYIDWLEKQTGITYRLPTDAEWEKAAKGPEGYDYCNGNKYDPKAANVFDSDTFTTTEVGSYQPNGFGLFDMDGNVQEWVSNYCRADEKSYYATMPDRDPTGPAKTDDGVLKGGCFLAKNYCNYRRGKFMTDQSTDCFGFRIARDVIPSDCC